MLERICRQLKEVGLTDNFTVVTGAAQRDLVLAYIGDKGASVLAEPARRNTFPAIALACAQLHFEKHCPDDETVLVMPVDSYVENDYFRLLAELEGVFESQKDADLLLVGAIPTFPSAKYGYIVPEDREAATSLVTEFREKPTEPQAAELIKKGALWNCGVFVFKLGYMLAELSKRIALTSYEAVLKQYNALEKESFDRVLPENGARAAVCKYGGSWVDIGTWNTLADVMGTRVIGNARLDCACENTQVINTTDKPVVVMGAMDMIVVATDEGILVADKLLTPFILEMTDDL
ncbi:MAG: hypothetical protein LBQ80_05420 [Clostridium sp.]|jgi:mannose-1-phosphate guanylyltransferase|nr:hypothetical protein [Clostridium sp.]